MQAMEMGFLEQITAGARLREIRAGFDGIKEHRNKGCSALAESIYRAELAEYAKELAGLGMDDAEKLKIRK